MNKSNHITIQLLLIILTLITFQSCELYELKPTPILCLNKHIKFIKKYAGNCTAYIIECEFQNSLVYYIKPGTCSEHEQVLIIDSKCDTLGHLLGANGNCIINGEDFYENARKLRTIWKN